MSKKSIFWRILLIVLAVTMMACVLTGCNDEEEEDDILTSPKAGTTTQAPGATTAPATTSGPAVNGNIPGLGEVHWDTVENDDGTKEPFVIAQVLLPAGVDFSDIYIFRGDSTDEKDLIGIQTGQRDHDVMYNPEPNADGTTWAKFAGRVYWFDKPENIPGEDDTITVVVTGWDKSGNTETPYSNKFTGKVKDILIRK